MGKGIVKRLFKGDKVIWMVITVLFALSFIEVFSATSTLAYKGDNYWQPISMHVTFMLVGVVAAWIVHNMPMSWLKNLATAGYWIGIIFLVWAMVDGVSINDSGVVGILYDKQNRILLLIFAFIIAYIGGFTAGEIGWNCFF